LIIIIRYLA